jgi:hypothetical protein
VKKYFVFLVLSSVLIVHAASWREMKNFNLKKDQMAIVSVKTEGLDRNLSFRWTLYTDKALVVHEKFDRIVGQHVLYDGHNDSFRKRLLPAKNSEMDVPYALVVFKKYDETNQTVQFDLLLFDKESRVKLDYLTK